MSDKKKIDKMTDKQLEAEIRKHMDNVADECVLAQQKEGVEE